MLEKRNEKFHKVEFIPQDGLVHKFTGRHARLKIPGIVFFFVFLKSTTKVGNH